MSERCYVSHYTSVILHHVPRFRCECSTAPSVSSLHISLCISLPELLNKLEAAPTAFCPLSATKSTHAGTEDMFVGTRNLISNSFSLSSYLYFCSQSVCVVGCWHPDKWQRSWSDWLPGGVWIWAGVFYSCHSAPRFRPRSNPDLSPAPQRKLPTNPPWHRWDCKPSSIWLRTEAASHVLFPHITSIVTICDSVFFIYILEQM